MTIDDTIEPPEQLPLFIRHKDFRFDNEPTWFYYVGRQEGIENVPAQYLYNAERFGSTYSYESIIKDIRKGE